MSQAKMAEIRECYKRRERIDAEFYDPLIPFDSKAIRERFYAITRLIRWARLEPFSRKAALEIGFGKGANLLELLLLGVLPENPVRNELLDEQAATARKLLPPSTRVLLGNGAGSLLNSTWPNSKTLQAIRKRTKANWGQKNEVLPGVFDKLAENLIKKDRDVAFEVTYVDSDWSGVCSHDLYEINRRRRFWCKKSLTRTSIVSQKIGRIERL